MITLFQQARGKKNVFVQVCDKSKATHFRRNGGILSIDQLITNESTKKITKTMPEETPLEMPTMNFGQIVKKNKNDDSPLVMPSMFDDGKTNSKCVTRNSGEETPLKILRMQF
jgi:hypothetical protein